MDVGISGQMVSLVLTADPCTNGIVPVILRLYPRLENTETVSWVGVLRI